MVQATAPPMMRLLPHLAALSKALGGEAVNWRLPPGLGGRRQGPVRGRGGRGHEEVSMKVDGAVRTAVNTDGSAHSAVIGWFL